MKTPSPATIVNAFHSRSGLGVRWLELVLLLLLVSLWSVICDIPPGIWSSCIHVSTSVTGYTDEEHTKKTTTVIARQRRAKDGETSSYNNNLRYEGKHSVLGNCASLVLNSM